MHVIYHNRLEGVLQDRHWLTHLCDRGVGEWWAQYHHDSSNCHNSRPLINAPQWFYHLSMSKSTLHQPLHIIGNLMDFH